MCYVVIKEVFEHDLMKEGVWVHREVDEAWQSQLKKELHSETKSVLHTHCAAK